MNFGDTIFTSKMSNPASATERDVTHTGTPSSPQLKTSQDSIDDEEQDLDYLDEDLDDDYNEFDNRLRTEGENLTEIDANEEEINARIVDDGNIDFSPLSDLLTDSIVNFPNKTSSESFSANVTEPADLPSEEAQSDFDFGELQAVDSMGNAVNGTPKSKSSLLTFTDARSSTAKLVNLVYKSSQKNIGFASNSTVASRPHERRNRAEEININSTIDISAKRIPNFNYKHHWTEDFATEIKEWFLPEDTNLLYELRTQYVCSYRSDWRSSTNIMKKRLLDSWIKNLDSENELVRSCALSYITYVALGSYETVTSTQDHIDQIKANTKFLWQNNTLAPLYKIITNIVNVKVPKNLCDAVPDDCYDDMSDEEKIIKEQSLNNNLFVALTAMYFIVESHRDDPEFAEILNQLDESILEFFIESISRLRWVLKGDLPLRPMLLLFWKCVLCLFGNSDTLDDMKSYMLKKYNLLENTNDDLVMASPLDYHVFRQDIISRYPSYIPPTSVLPDFFDKTYSMAQYIEVPRPVKAQTINSTLPVPTVHIATPAPSPPASPAFNAGQKIRKSVFMTNQSFPFIHPTDENVPESIVEASELFRSRVRTTPSMVQLWDEKDRFMQQERGWVPYSKKKFSFEESQKEETILKRIDKLYINSMPHLNSFVLVFLKFFLANASFTTPEIRLDTYLSSHGSGYETRAKDIGLKAVSSAIFSLVEWFELSHICKAEYLKSLLFDSKYYLVVFKYLYSHTPMERALDTTETLHSNFFKNCKEFSTCWSDEEERAYQERVEREEKEEKEKQMEESNIGDTETEEEIETSKYVPKYSKRYFLTTINLLYILHKMIHKKTQRILIVGELPPDPLKKMLSIFQSDVWTLVLEIFKEQVPFNRRKWRTCNMDLVSAIYLHCKTKLKDDWLVNGDPAAEMSDASLQEGGIRALIQFYNERVKRETMKMCEYSQEEEVENLKTEGLTNDDDVPSFFALELHAMALGNTSM